MSQYNEIDHITHAELAALVGKEQGALTVQMKHEGGPRILGSIELPRERGMSYYGRGEAMAWVEGIERPEYRGEIVPARHPKPLHAQGVYRPSPVLSINMARAAELYPHRLITPRGIGNEVTFQYGFGERS